MVHHCQIQQEGIAISKKPRLFFQPHFLSHPTLQWTSFRMHRSTIHRVMAMHLMHHLMTIRHRVAMAMKVRNGLPTDQLLSLMLMRFSLLTHHDLIALTLSVCVV